MLIQEEINEIVLSEFWIPMYEFLFGKEEIEKLLEEYKIIGYNL